MGGLEKNNNRNLEGEAGVCLIGTTLMNPKVFLSFRRFLAGLLVAAIPTVFGLAGSGSDYSQKSVAELIDNLTQIDSQSPGINSATIYEGFIANDSPGSFHGGVLGVPAPKVPPQMSELVRRGPVALPELIKHLDDRRPTRLEVGNKPSGKQVGVDVFMFMFFSDEYDPRVPHWFSEEDWKTGPQPMAKTFKGRYIVKVGDVCFVLIGQIVNRRLLAVRYQPSAGLVVNSPIEAPVLVERVRSDWGNADAEVLKGSLLQDVQARNHPKRISRAEYTERFVNPALARLRLFFPDAYYSLEGSDLQKRKMFERQENKNRHLPHTVTAETSR